MATLDFLSGQVLRSTAGAIYTGAKASYWSDAGATTPLTTYSDAGLSSANTNPVVADGTTGAFGPIYLQAKRYWRTVTTSADVSLPQFDLGPIDAGMTLVTSAAAPSPTYPLMYWYDTTSGNLKRRNAADSAWLDLGGIDSLLNAASVTEQLAFTSAAKSSTPDSVAALHERGTDIASAGTISLPATGGRHYNITGTTTITGISSASGGRTVEFKFAAALTLTHNGTSLILPGAANITTAAGDIFEFTNEAAQGATGSNWKCTKITRASGSQLNIADQLGSQADAEAGTSTTKTLPISLMKNLALMPKAWVVFNGTGTPAITASSNVTSITDNGVGDYTINFTTAMSSTAYAWYGTARAATAGAGACVTAESGDTKSASALQIKVRRTSTDAAFDSTEVAVFVFGDFA